MAGGAAARNLWAVGAGRHDRQANGGSMAWGTKSKRE